MHKKIPNICTGCRVSEAKIYLYHSTEIAKARTHSKESRSSGPCLKHHNQRTPMYATQHHSSKIRVTPTSSKSLRKFNSLEKTTAQPEYLMN